MYITPPSPEPGQGLPAEDIALAGRHGFSLSETNQPGPTVEVRDLFRRLYGAPGRSPQPANCIRLRAKAHGAAGTSAGDSVDGSIEFRYWPHLGLGYVESVHVNGGMRRGGLGRRLLDFAVELMASKGVGRSEACVADNEAAGGVHAFIVSPEGLRLFTAAGFVPEPAADAAQPWRSWASLRLDGAPTE